MYRKSIKSVLNHPKSVLIVLKVYLIILKVYFGGEGRKKSAFYFYNSKNGVLLIDIIVKKVHNSKNGVPLS